MADIAATDVTYTMLRQVPLRTGAKGLIVSTVKLTFGNGTLTYPTNGIPLDKSKLGCPNWIDAIVLSDEDDASGIVWKYDRDNNKLRAYIPGITVSATGGTMQGYPLNTGADALASAMNISLNNAVGAGTYHLGQLKELINTKTPAAQTLYVLCFGW